jgi:hypothetical protein
MQMRLNSLGRLLKPLYPHKMLISSLHFLLFEDLLLLTLPHFLYFGNTIAALRLLLLRSILPLLDFDCFEDFELSISSSISTTRSIGNTGP